MTSFSSARKPYASAASEMIFGAVTPLVIQMVHIGSKVVTWYIVPTTVYGWEISFIQIGTCFSPLILVPNFTPPQEPSLVDQFMLVIALVITISSCSNLLFCRTVLSCVVNITHSLHETAYLKTLCIMAKQCSKFGISTK